MSFFGWIQISNTKSEQGKLPTSVTNSSGGKLVRRRQSSSKLWKEHMSKLQKYNEREVSIRRQVNERRQNCSALQRAHNQLSKMMDKDATVQSLLGKPKGQVGVRK